MTFTEAACKLEELCNASFHDIELETFQHGIEHPVHWIMRTYDVSITRRNRGMFWVFHMFHGYDMVKDGEEVLPDLFWYANSTERDLLLWVNQGLSQLNKTKYVRPGVYCQTILQGHYKGWTMRVT